MDEKENKPIVIKKRSLMIVAAVVFFGSLKIILELILND
jgi:hypothetical protein